MSTPDQDRASAAPRRRWFQFTMAGLLVFTLICAVLAGVFAMHQRQIQLERAQAAAARAQAEAARVAAEQAVRREQAARQIAQAQVRQANITIDKLQESLEKAKAEAHSLSTRLEEISAKTSVEDGGAPDSGVATPSPRQP